MTWRSYRSRATAKPDIHTHPPVGSTQHARHFPRSHSVRLRSPSLQTRTQMQRFTRTGRYLADTVPHGHRQHTSQNFRENGKAVGATELHPGCYERSEEHTSELQS